MTIGFDFYKIDGWDWENFEVYIDDVLVLDNPFGDQYAWPASGTFTGGSWARSTEDFGALGYGANSWDTDGIFHYTLTLATSASSVKLGFGSSLDGSSLTDESWGVDNVTITQNTLAATGGNDTLYGTFSANTIHGYGGNDRLYGGGGDDDLYGDGGADTFVFESDTAFNNVVEIRDFTKTQNDKIDVSDLLDGYDPLTDAIADFVQITTSGSNSLLKVDVDGGGNNFVQIAQIAGVTGLTDEAALVNSGHLIAA